MHKTSVVIQDPHRQIGCKRKEQKHFILTAALVRTCYVMATPCENSHFCSRRAFGTHRFCCSWCKNGRGKHKVSCDLRNNDDSDAAGETPPSEIPAEWQERWFIECARGKALMSFIFISKEQMEDDYRGFKRFMSSLLLTVHPDKHGNGSENPSLTRLVLDLQSALSS